jgi:hypothetical protein
MYLSRVVVVPKQLFGSGHEGVVIVLYKIAQRINQWLLWKEDDQASGGVENTQGRKRV